MLKSRVEIPAAEVPRAVLTIAVATAIPSPSLEILPYLEKIIKKNTEQQYHTRHGNLQTQGPYILQFFFLLVLCNIIRVKPLKTIKNF